MCILLDQLQPWDAGREVELYIKVPPYVLRVGTFHTGLHLWFFFLPLCVSFSKIHFFCFSINDLEGKLACRNLHSLSSWKMKYNTQREEQNLPSHWHRCVEKVVLHYDQNTSRCNLLLGTVSAFQEITFTVNTDCSQHKIFIPLV